MTEKMKVKYTFVYESEVDCTAYGEPEGFMRQSIVLSIEKEMAPTIIAQALENGYGQITVEAIK